MESSPMDLERTSTTSSSSSSDYSRSSSANSTSSDESIASIKNEYIPGEDEMKRVFARFDENADGLICPRDLHRFMSRLGVDMSVAEAKSMLQSVDHNSDGCVDFKEFYSLYLSMTEDDGVMHEEETEDEDPLVLAFNSFDKNRDGRISAQELQEVLMRLGIPEARNIRNCEKMIQRVDSNGDGLIEMSEFKAMMSRTCFQDC